MTLHAQLWSEGVQVGDDITTGFEDHGGGVYSWSYELPDDFAGVILFLDEDDIEQASTAWPDPQQIKLNQILAAVAAWNPSQVVSSSAVLENGKVLETVRGDSYTVGSPRGPLEWTIEDDTDLTGATVAFTSRNKATDEIELEAEGSIINPAAETKTVRVELTAEDTAALTPGDKETGLYKTNKFDVQITLVSGAVWTPIRGGGISGGHTIIEDQTR